MSETEDVCPVCGQEYVHTRDASDPYDHDLRDDFTECRRSMDIPGERGTVFVHEPSGDVNVTRETVVKHVNRDNPLGSTGGVGDRFNLWRRRGARHREGRGQRADDADD